MKCLPLARTFLALGILTVVVPLLGAAEPDYTVTDPELQAVRLDSAPTESFLAVRADAAGRLFVGGREGLFVYEPDDQGGYRPRRELYHFPKDTWVYDIEIRGNDLYVITVSALYLVEGAVTRREGLRPRRLIWGVPLGHVHQCFHGLAWGPEGDLYFSMGDPVAGYGDFNRPDHWMHWTFFSQPEGTRTPYTGVGGVCRCHPDGSGFQVVAGGTRNSVGLAFDRSWNLFSNDNDHESIPAEYVPGRLLHVTPHAYFSWPRGWMPLKTPDRADLLDTMFDGMGRAVPVGEAYYDETFLPAKYRDNLLVARWGIRAVTRYPLEHRGASFKATEHVLLSGRDQARPVGVAVGRDGRIFVTVAYMAHNDASPVYKSDLVMITRADDPPAHPFRPYDITAATPEKLWAELADPSWERRQRAHVEILRRGGALLEEAAGRLTGAKIDSPAFPHLLWLAAAAKSDRSRELTARFLQNANAQVRLQAVRAVDEFFPPGERRRELLTRALADPDPQVRHAAVVGFFKDDAEPPEEITTGPARSTDTYLRQAATLLLAEKAAPDRLAALCRASDQATRLAGVLAAGFRLTLPPATKPIAPDLPLDKLPAREAYVIQFADARVDLRDDGRIGNFTVADHWRAGKHTAEQERLFALLQGMLADADEQVRLQAAHFLFLLNDPRSEPAVAKVCKDSEERRLAAAPAHGINKVWLVGPFPDGDAGLATVHPPERGPVDLAAAYDGGKGKLTWKEFSPGNYYDFLKAFGPCDHSSFYAYCRLAAQSRQRALLLVGSDDGVKVWHNGKAVWSNEVVRSALPFQDVIVLDLQPGSNDVLVRVQNVAGECGLYLHYRALGQVVPELPEKVTTATLAERLKSAAGGPAPVGPEFLKVDWEQALARGDARRGRQLFGSLGCVKCHGITADAGVVGGPSLAEAKKRFTVPYVVESVLLPSKQVSPLFRATFIETQRGVTLTGLVVAETGDKLELLLPDTTRKTLAKADVAERRLLETSPMPQGLVKTPEELRDLLAYLFSDNPQAP
jgi:putative heme-binding domain-containing protein